jgi:hypothetical protein
MEKKPKIITKPIIKKIMHNNKIMKENEQKKRRCQTTLTFQTCDPCHEIISVANGKM